VCLCTVEGRTVHGCKDFDFSFGGRRQFCKSDYADLGKCMLSVHCQVRVLPCTLSCMRSLGHTAFETKE